MKKLRLVLCVGVAFMACGCDEQRAGRIEATRIPTLHGHYEPEHAYDAAANVRRWTAQSPGLHASFGETDRSYLHSEVPQVRESVSWEGTGWRGERLNAVVLAWSADAQEQVRLTLT